MKVFFDLDPAVYMSAFAAQSPNYGITYYNSEDCKQLRSKYFTDGNEKNKWKRENPDIVIEDEWKDLVVEEESHALQCAKTLVNNALQRLRRKFGKKLEVEYFLTGKGNFREEIATIAKYKGNRDKVDKPIHYQAVRDYYVESWGAEIIEGIEADDEVSIRSWEIFRNSPEDYCIATIDKDLDQIPGMHYDYSKHVFYEVDALDGELFFFAQCLSGDATDNIKGCYRVGQAKALKLVHEVFDEWADDRNWRVAVWNKIVEMYDENMHKYPDKYPKKFSAYSAALENARLVYMMQRRGELWEPPQNA